MFVLLFYRTELRVPLSEVGCWPFMSEKGYSATLRLHNHCQYKNKLDSIRRARVTVSGYTTWNSAYQGRICSGLSFTLECKCSFWGNKTRTHGNRGISVETVTKLQLDGRGLRFGSWKRQEFMCSPPCPDQFWRSSKGKGALSPGLKQPQRDADHSSSSSIGVQTSCRSTSA